MGEHEKPPAENPKPPAAPSPDKKPEGSGGAHRE